MRLPEWLIKIWRNPPWMCPRCNSVISSYDRAFRNYDIVTIKSGFNKKHTHELKKKENLSSMAPSATPVYYWHVHHEKLVEALTEPIKNRIDYIKRTKLDSVETRLHFMQPVKNPPIGVDGAAVAQAQKVFDTVAKANNQGNSDNATLQRAYNALVAAKKKNVAPTQAQWEALHKIECYHYCPWNGKTLLPSGRTGRL